MMPDGHMHMGDVLVRGFSARLGAVPPPQHLEVEAVGFHPALAHATNRVEQEMTQFWDAPQSEWYILFGVVCTLICLDALVSKKLTTRCHKTHIATLTVWIIVALLYNVFFFVRNGAADGMDWFLGYVLEWMLAVDNLFAFQFILKSFRAPPPIQDKALFCGILGSIVTRFFLFTAFGSALKSIHYIQFAFGFLLIYGGIKALQDEDNESSDIPMLHPLKRFMGTRLRESYDMENHQLFVRDPEDGRLCATLLVPLIFCVIVADVIFAVDSVSAKVAQIPDVYIDYSSSVFALLGMRAMFFVLDDLVKYFELLKYGVSFILIFIGVELMAAGRFQLPEWIVLLGIVTVFNVCIVASVLIKNFNGKALLGTSMATGAAQEHAPQEADSSGSGEDSGGRGPEGAGVADEALDTTPAAETGAEEFRRKMQTRFEATEARQKPAVGTASPSQPEAVQGPCKKAREETAAGDQY